MAKDKQAGQQGTQVFEGTAYVLNDWPGTGLTELIVRVEWDSKEQRNRVFKIAA